MVNTKLGGIGVKHIEEKEYNWSYDRTNSKGKVIFRHDTNETMEEASNFLKEKGIEYEEKRGGSMIWIHYKYQLYSYYPTTGKWSPWNKGGYPDKHYASKGIEDFYTRFLLADKPTFKSDTETKKEVKKILDDEQIEYKIKKDTITLITKSIPRKDGKGNRRRYSYEYIVGKGKWRNINSDGTPNEKFYQVSNIENFLTKFFNDDIEVVKHETK